MRQVVAVVISTFFGLAILHGAYAGLRDGKITGTGMYTSWWTERMKARVRHTATRNEQPYSYWFGLASWCVLGGGFLGFAYLNLVGVIKG